MESRIVTVHRALADPASRGEAGPIGLSVGPASLPARFRSGESLPRVNSCQDYFLNVPAILGRIEPVELIKPNININFLGNGYYAYAFTTIMILLSLASIPIKGYMKLGIDFTGGAVVQVKFNKPVHTDQAREALKPLGENLVVQQFPMASGEEFVIRMEQHDEPSEKLSQQVKDLLDSKIGKGSTEIRSVEMVGPKVGKDLRIRDLGHLHRSMFASHLHGLPLHIYNGTGRCCLFDTRFVHSLRFFRLDRKRVQFDDPCGHADYYRI